MQFLNLRRCGDTPSPYITHRDSSLIQSPSWIPIAANVSGASKGNLNTLSRLALNNNAELRVYGRCGFLHSPHLQTNSDSEFDLAALVQDYIENGSNSNRSDIRKRKAEMKIAAEYKKLFDSLQMMLSESASIEKQLQSVMDMLSLSVNDKGGHVHELLAMHFRKSGFDAAVSVSKLKQSGKLHGGEYRYIDIITNSEVDQLIIDIDFRSQFEIARATHSYMKLVRTLPLVFVGSVEKLSGILNVMAEAVMLSMQQNDMPVPPWRTLEYMKSKWLSSDKKRLTIAESSSKIADFTKLPQANKVVEKLEHLKISLRGSERRMPIKSKGSTVSIHSKR